MVIRSKKITSPNEPKYANSDAKSFNLMDTAPQTVGGLLQIKRQEVGVDLREAAEFLNIRYAYLLAIEEGQVDDLPGAAYAMGFVRAYSDYLGLDGAAIVERYKDETAELGDDVRLVFPSPLPEGKVPSGAIILIGLLALILVYGAWVVLAQQNEKFAKLVPALPGNFSSSLGSDKSASTSANPASDVPTTAALAPVKALVSEGEATPPTVPEKKPEVARTASADTLALRLEAANAANVNVTEAVSERLTALNKQATTSEQSALVAGTETSDPALSQSTIVAPILGAPVTSVNHAQDQTTKVAVPLPPKPPAVASAEPRLFGRENTGSRIMIKARIGSWVQIRDQDGKKLLTRVLRAGDSYLVPNKPGLLMETGNAGGLEITVDSVVIPDIGPIGAVRRNIALDTETLKAGSSR